MNTRSLLAHFDGVCRIGSMTSQECILFMDKQAEIAADILIQTKAFTVIVQDSCSIHTCKTVKDKLKEWKKRLVFISVATLLFRDEFD
jgi:hypothetical protein